jgi:hypothetical protein
MLTGAEDDEVAAFKEALMNRKGENAKEVRRITTRLLRLFDADTCPPIKQLKQNVFKQSVLKLGEVALAPD